MLAMILKELRQLRRDRRTLALMVVLPLVMLVIFGYAASFDIGRLRTLVVGPGAEELAATLPADRFDVTVRPGDGEADARHALEEGEFTLAVVTGSDVAGERPLALVDGVDLFGAKAAISMVQQAPVPPEVEIVHNPDLKTSTVMVPPLIGLIMLFIGTVITSLGVVRERQAGTLEQLAVMPLRARDVIVGKIAPYFAVAAFDMAVVTAIGILLFDVPFRGAPPLFALGVVLFLFLVLGIGVLISTVSENQGQAIQLAIMAMLPQVLLSGMIFPLESMAAGVRWIAYVLPLTWFTMLSRGVLLRGTSLAGLALPLAALAVLGALTFGLAVWRFRRDLAPSARRTRSHSGELAGAGVAG